MNWNQVPRTTLLAPQIAHRPISFSTVRHLSLLIALVLTAILALSAMAEATPRFISGQTVWKRSETIHSGIFLNGIDAQLDNRGQSDIQGIIGKDARFNKGLSHSPA